MTAGALIRAAGGSPRRAVSLSASAMAAARGIGPARAGAGFVVVSGLAAGIDTHAHQGALAGGGKTVAVLGTGVDVVFPASNADLSREVAASGALLTEHPPGTPAEKHNFPRRNRIVAALSACVVVVEAPPGSGALITAALAMEHVPVLAVPGPIDRMHAGCHALLRQGARLCEGVGDVFQALEREAPPMDAAARPGADRAPPAGPALVVWRALDPDEAMDLDEIALRTGLSPDAVAEGATLLELDGRAVRVPGVGLRKA